MARANGRFQAAGVCAEELSGLPTPGVVRRLSVMLHRPFVSRLFSLGDQLLFSITNFALTLALARIFSTTAFGIFGLASSLALLASGFQKAIYVIPLSLGSRHRIVGTRRARTGEHAIFLLAMEAAVCVAAIAAAALQLDSVTVQTCIALIGCCAIFLQADFDRALLLKLHSSHAAALASLLYLICAAASVGLAYWLALSFLEFIAVFAALCIGKALIVMALSDAFPDFGLGKLLLRRNLRRYGLPALVSTGVAAGMNQVPVMILAITSGVKEVALYVAMRSLAQPFFVVIRSLDANDKNRFLERANGTPGGMGKVLWQTLGLYVGLGLASTLILILLTPQITHLAFNDAFPPRRDLVGGWLIYCTLLAASMPVQSLIYMLGRQKKTIFWNCIAGLSGALSAIALSPTLGALGTLISTIIAIAVIIIGGIHSTRDISLQLTKSSFLPKERL